MPTSDPLLARRGAHVNGRAALVAVVLLAMLLSIDPRAHAADFPTISRVWFEDDDQGWFVANPGEGPPSTGIEFVVGATTNGGANWALEYGPPNGMAGELFFVSDSIGWTTHGWVFGSRLLTTRDGGESWAVQVDSPDVYLTDVYFTDASVGWMKRTPDFRGSVSVQRTGDGGASWDTALRHVHKPGGGGGPVSFVGQSHAWLATWYPHGLFATVDGGQTWTRTETPDTQFAFLHFVSPEVGWAGSATPGERFLHRSEDGGQSWTALPMPGVGSLGSLERRSDFWSETEIWMVVRPATETGGSRLIATEDGGATWETLYESDARINDIHRVDQDTAWLAGETLVRTTDAGRTWEKIDPVMGRATAVSPRNRRVTTWATIRRNALQEPRD